MEKKRAAQQLSLIQLPRTKNTATKSSVPKTVAATVPAGNVYELKVTLVGARPSVWRRLQVHADVTLRRLHEVLQVAMGWDNMHLYEFGVGSRRFAEPEPDSLLAQLYGKRSNDSRAFTLREVAPAVGTKLTYLYDFGDCWRHAIVVEDIHAEVSGVVYPVCVAGRNACPPEDCGGAGGYAMMLEALKDPDHPGAEEWSAWAGPSFLPGRFDVADANRQLAGFTGVGKKSRPTVKRPRG